MRLQRNISPPVPPDPPALRSFFVAGAFVLAVAAAAYAAWEAGLISRSVKETHTFVVPAATAGEMARTTEVRTIYLPGGPRASARTGQEVKLPDGRWADCRGDCARAFRNR